MTPARAAFRALGTTAVVAVASPSALSTARRLLARELRALDLACSRFRDDSELAALVRAGGRPAAAGLLLRDALRVALRAAAETGGLVDPTVGRAMRRTGYDRTFARLELRDGRVFRPAFEAAGRWREIELDDRSGTVRVPRGVELDLGATAKALAADRAAGAIARVTGTGVLVAVGGDVAIGGPVPRGGWSVAIAHDHRQAPPDAPTVALTSGGLATSSTRVRRWATASGTLHHILDPRTGGPANTPWATVSVAAASCVDANTASTAAFVLGDDAPAWLAERRLPARLVSTDGAVVRVGGWPA